MGERLRLLDRIVLRRHRRARQLGPGGADLGQAVGTRQAGRNQCQPEAGAGGAAFALAVHRRELDAGGTAEFAGGGSEIATLDDLRSEEHTSELQSLMRTSYAVFCLKKK